MAEEKQKTHWHPGFCSAVRLELRENRADLDYTNEYNINRKPIQIDLLVIKKTASVEINNEIGKIFRGYNIMEYKSPKAALNIDTYFKGLAYACLYKAGGGYVNEISAEDITVSFVRDRKPVKLLQNLEEKKRKIECVANGIYYISLKREDEKDFADSVLEVAMSANRNAFHRVKEGVDMCNALRELMAPEIEAELEAARKRVTEEVTEQVTERVTEQVTERVTEQVTERVTETVETKERLTTIRNIMKNLKMDATSAMSAMGLAEQDQKKYLAML